MLSTLHHAESVIDREEVTLADRIAHWVRFEAPWFLASLTGHVFVLLILALVAKNIVLPNKSGGEAVIEAAAQESAEAPSEKIEKFELGPTPIEPTRINIDETDPPDVSNGPLMPSDVPGIPDGPSDRAPGPIGPGDFPVPSKIVDLQGKSPLRNTNGIDSTPGKGIYMPGGGLDGRPIPPGGGGGGGPTGKAPRTSDRAVAAGLHWLAQHQNRDGSWSLKGYTRQCNDPTCTGAGEMSADAAATALGMLPLLAAGQTHYSKGIYAHNVNRALYWMLQQQQPDGNFAATVKGNAAMYSHALATIAMCELAAMEPRDGQVRTSAQKAVNYLLAAQNPGTGGWRYTPGEDGDTSVVGWAVMALKSAEMAKLSVRPAGFDGAQKWLDSCAHGSYRELYAYRPESNATPSMSAVGMLCGQYLGTLKPGLPRMDSGVDYLLKQLPKDATTDRDIYFWYYATQVLHNVQDARWDDWNRQVRRILINTQIKEGCALGSWDPDKPARDRWGTAGGRLMVTSLSVLTLEVYYRYLPLFQYGNEQDLKQLPKLDDKGVE